MREERLLTPARLCALLASLLLGVATALALMPRVFRATPTDVSRIGVLLDALRAPGTDLAVAVFGNSVIMSGIDAGQLREELDGRPVAWNFASTGQSLVEAYLLTQDLPRSVRVALYTLELRPAASETPLHAQKYNTFYMFGFRPSTATVERLGGIYGRELRDLLTRSHVAQLFEARWAARQLADTQLRRLLRRDLRLASADDDLIHPQRYTTPIAPELLQRFLLVRRRALEQSPPAVPDAELELARHLAQEAAQARRRGAFLLPPVHPGLRAGDPGAYAHAAAAITAALEPGALVIDATALLPAEDFIDDLHPTDAGARVLTHFVAQRLAGTP